MAEDNGNGNGGGFFDTLDSVFKAVGAAGETAATLRDRFRTPDDSGTAIPVPSASTVNPAPAAASAAVPMSFLDNLARHSGTLLLVSVGLLILGVTLKKFAS